MGEFTIPIGEIETILEGEDITIISYGSTLRLVMNTAKRLLQEGISAEIIDLQSLIPFDLKNQKPDFFFSTMQHSKICYIFYQS